jgi:CheY-like chemotaxis protein
VTLPLSRKRLLVAVEDAELASLLSAAAARLGAEVSVAAGGTGVAAALAAGADAAIVDLPLPDIGVAELLAACARAGVPAIAVSGVYRGERGVEELRRLGAREVFEKPFPVDAVVAAAARLAGATATPPVPGDADADAEVPALLSDDDPSISATTLPALDEPPPATAPAPRDGFATPLPETRRSRPPDPEAPPATRGTLGTTTVPRLLAALHVGQATGALAVERGAVRKILVVERGVPVYAASNVAGERLAAICVRRGLVAAERMDALRRGAPAARTAELLAADGLLPPGRHAELVAAQIRAIAWSTFEWRDGSYAFQLGRPPAGRVPVTLAMADVILEGVLRTATLDRLRAELPADTHLAPAPDPAFELWALRLRPADARLLPLADGTKSVADLVRLSDQPERDTLAFLQACRVMRVLDAVDRVLASTRRIGFM